LRGLRERIDALQAPLGAREPSAGRPERPEEAPARPTVGFPPKSVAPNDASTVDPVPDSSGPGAPMGNDERGSAKPGEPKLPAHVGRYKVEEKDGEGGMGAVLGGRVTG